MTPEERKASRLASARKYQKTEKGREASRRKAAKWRKENPEKHLWWLARSRALDQGCPFTIEVSDIKIPEFCPVLKIPLFRRDEFQGPNSPTLDKVIPELGYTKENTCVISSKANTWKSNMSVDDLNILANWVSKEAARIKEKTKQ